MNSKNDHKLLLIGGGSGSGKTRIAKELLNTIYNGKALSIAMDSFYRDLTHLNESQIRNYNFDHPDAIDEDELIKRLEILLNDGQTRIPTYFYSSQKSIDNGDFIKSGGFIILEGIFALHYPRLLNLAHAKIYIECSSDIRLIRRIERDIQERGFSLEYIIHQYLSSVKPMHDNYIQPSKKQADIVIGGDGKIEDILNQLKNWLKEKGLTIEN